MVFKRSAILLAAVAAAAVASTEAAAPVEVQTSFKHPVVKSATHANGKLTLTLVDAAPKKVHHAKKHHEVKKAEHKKAEVKKTEAKKPAAKKHHEVKKPVAHKQVSQTKDDKEVVKKYPHGQVHIAAKGTDAAKPAKKHHHKKAAKQEPTEEEEPVDVEDDEGATEEEGDLEGSASAAGKNEDDVGDEVDTAAEEQDFRLPVGDSVDITIDDEVITLKHFENGSVVMYSTAGVEVINAKEIYLDFEIDDDASSASGASDNSTVAVPEPAVGSASAAEDNTLAGEIKKDVSAVAKKFSELATKLTGNGMKEAAPIIFIGGAIGALAAVVGIAAIAIGRARSNSAAADPASVLADATEDVEADVEAGTEEKKDTDAEESQSLDSSDSESEADEEQEEGKFTNEVASV